MSNVTNISERRNNDDKPKKEMLPKEWLCFLITAVVLFGPTVLFCQAIGHNWPLAMIATTHVVGGAVGAVTHVVPRRNQSSCVPAQVSNAPLSHTVEEKKAA